jgi:sterol desaturase/sphingolipid hydroxylase (fatty acid hydroxylase superfamily)
LPFLWRFHEIHHLDSRFDSTTGLRIHFGEVVIQNIFRAFPIVLLAIPLNSVLIFELILIMGGLFHHASFRISKKIENILSKIIVTPLRHCVHHHSLYTHWNSNFGFIFIWWDKLMGTYCDAERQSNWHIGLGYSPDLNCTELFITPFKLKKLRYRMKEQGFKVVRDSLKEYS